MPNKTKSSSGYNSDSKYLNENRGLTPISSGTPMPKIKPAAQPVANQNSQSAKNKTS